LDIGLMIEGQEGLTWERWTRIAQAAESLGFAGLFRSDHFTIPHRPNMDSLELWTSLTWLASHTSRIEFGPLVAPVSFRHPVFIARMGKDIDTLSDGRLVLGIGSGWQDLEHAMFGFPLLKGEGRFDRFEEGVEVVYRLLRDTNAVTYQGAYYQLRNAKLLPPPKAPGRPPLLIGGSGRKRTLPLAARYADEWNCNFVSPAEFNELSRFLDDLLEQEGREAASVRRSLMINILFSATAEGLARKAEARGSTVEAQRQRTIIMGVGDEILPQLAAYQSAGVERVMLQWLELDDLEGIAALAEIALPAFPGI
jgi:F420-dependent oxidoreductase-like protein